MADRLTYVPPGRLEKTRFEKLHLAFYEHPEKAAIDIAHCIADLIRSKQKEKKTCVLGLATGNSPLNIYKKLIQLHQNEGLSFHNVMTFNLDEYFPISPEDANSYYHYMHSNLFDHIDIDKRNVHIPRGDLDRHEISEYCNRFENEIKKAGGIDLQLLGIGQTGHIGFNEPGSHLNSRTRLITLDYVTRRDAAKTFEGFENVPRRAITMGVKTILEARRIFIMAWGENKAKIVQKAVEESETEIVTASFLQEHRNTTFILDEQAASELTRFKTPWVVRHMDWDDDQTILHAVTWLCGKTKKSILKLSDEDYNQNSLSELISLHGPSYDLNIKMFNRLQHTITGWPGGKPNTDDTNRPERSSPSQKRVLIFSPHPDDDVISMGGSFDRLVTQGHQVHIGYQTSGSVAVTDEDAIRFLEVTLDFNSKQRNPYIEHLIDCIKNKNLSPEQFRRVLHLKGTIRKRESLAATRYFGLPDHQVHFLNLPFYETGKAIKNPPSQKDLEIVVELIDRVKPHQIFAAGDLADPHGTHRVCLNIIFEALSVLKSKPYMKDCWVWLYRGAWEEWELHQIDMAIPMSPDQVLRKRKAIFYHETQKDGAMFQGNDEREFWVRAEDRNRTTAEQYRKMGLAEYAAMEAFKRYYY
ncbi:MAG: glucosamine-6-phosphate deaminase [Flavobacteriaceae bacterium]|nr:glucosamine-6-phosphate deaminase [Flavobacteriaceae bacterium]